MDFRSAATDSTVLDLLRSIEDKLYERGTLVKVTGDSESNVTISFNTIAVRGEQVHALVIAVETTKAPDLNSSDWESLSDCVNEEFLQNRSLIQRNILSVLDLSCGQYVMLNGKIVY